MITEDEARKSLEELIDKYIPHHPEKDRLIGIVRDESRPGLPIRGILEHMKGNRSLDYSPEDIKLIEELIYLYG